MITWLEASGQSYDNGIKKAADQLIAAFLIMSNKGEASV